MSIFADVIKVGVDLHVLRNVRRYLDATERSNEAMRNAEVEMLAITEALGNTKTGKHYRDFHKKLVKARKAFNRLEHNRSIAIRKPSLTLTPVSADDGPFIGIKLTDMAVRLGANHGWAEVILNRQTFTVVVQDKFGSTVSIAGCDPFPASLVNAVPWLMGGPQARFLMPVQDGAVTIMPFTKGGKAVELSVNDMLRPPSLTVVD